MKRRRLLTGLGAGLTATLAGCSTATTTGFELEADDCGSPSDTVLWGQRSAARTGASAVDRSLSVGSDVTVHALGGGGDDPIASATTAPVLAGDYAVTPTSNNVVAHDRGTGRREWTFSLPSGEGVSTTPVVACDVVVAATAGAATYVVDLATGEQVGEIPVEGATRPERSPVVSESTLVVPGDGVTAYDLRDGETRWSEDAGDSEVGICADGSLVYVSYRTEAKPGIQAIGLESGDVEWTVEDPAAFDTPPAVGDSLLYAVTDASELVCVDAAAGDVEWRRPLPAKGYDRPAVTDGLVAVNAGRGERATVFDAETGDELATVETGGSRAQPVFTEDAVLVEGRDAGLVVLDGSSLDVVARHPSVKHVDSQLSVGSDAAFYVPALARGVRRVVFGEQ